MNDIYLCCFRFHFEFKLYFTLSFQNNFTFLEEKNYNGWPNEWRDAGTGSSFSTSVLISSCYVIILHLQGSYYTIQVIILNSKKDFQVTSILFLKGKTEKKRGKKRKPNFLKITEMKQMKVTHKLKYKYFAHISYKFWKFQ